MRTWWLLISLLVAPSALAGPARTLSSGDVALPPETRRIVALAEDEVALARLARGRATDAFETTRTYQVDLGSTVLPPGADAEAWAQLVKARVQLARATLSLAAAELGAAEARLDVVRAEVTLHHGRGLAPLKRWTTRAETAQQRVGDQRQRQRDAADTVVRAEDALWR